MIGGGPAGIFFCHAVETQRRKMMNEGNEAAVVASLPVVTCFERAPGPGGVWRSERTFAAAGDTEEKKMSETYPRSMASFDYKNANNATAGAPTTNMYEALWTNGPKECIEFFDYYLDEHFDHPLPVYMPRQPVLEYMIGRVTKNCPDFFEKYVQFNTSVEFVRYGDDKRKFKISTRDMLTGEEVVEEFDKCIWAGGENGRPKLPEAMLKMFREGGFSGKMIHSSDTADFENDVKGKQILLIGGSYSAEDLALMAVKCSAEKVYISSRQHDNVVSWTSAWPYNKIEVLEAQTPVRVTEDGRCIQFAKTWWKWPNQYVPYDQIQTEVRDIDTIIFCTGYQPNFGMLDENLRTAVKKDADLQLSVPKEWKMMPNKLTEFIGDVEAGDCRWINSVVGYPGLFRGLSINNPNMMFIVTSVDNPLVGIDVDSWLLLCFIMGWNKVPSAAEMMKQNGQDAMDQMNNSYLRYCMDENYAKAYDDVHFKHPEHRETMLRLYMESKSQHYEYYWRILARSMQEAKYPVSYGSYDELNETARTLIKYNSLSYYHRASLVADDKEKGKTFRDCVDSDQFRSIFTDDKAVPLKHRWLDIDANDESVQLIMN